MKILGAFVLIVWLCVTSAMAQSPPQASPSPTTQSQTVSNPKDGQASDPNKDYRDMFDKLLDRATWVFGIVGGFMMLLGTVIVGLVLWTLGQSRKEAKLAFFEEMKNRGLINFEAEYRSLQMQINAFNAFKDRRVDWIRPTSVAEPKKEIIFLERAGLKHVAPIPVTVGQKAIMLNNPDLVILSFDGSEQSKELVKLIVDLLRKSQKEVPILVYAPGPRVPDEEMKLLNETALHASANFPATLVTQALELVRLRQA